jgi:hypothetical protein
MAGPPDTRRGGPRQSPPPKVSTSTTQSVARDLDPDLWAALAVLDRTFGADQVDVLRVIPRRPA